MLHPKSFQTVSDQALYGLQINGKLKVTNTKVNSHVTSQLILHLPDVKKAPFQKT